MRRIDTGTVPTEMVEFQSRGYRTLHQSIGNAMREFNLPMLNADPAVSISRTVSSPFPAVIWGADVYLGPEAVGDRFDLSDGTLGKDVAMYSPTLIMRTAKVATP